MLAFHRLHFQSDGDAGDTGDAGDDKSIILLSKSIETSIRFISAATFDGNALYLLENKGGLVAG